MTLNQNEREPLPVEDQVIQIYAATTASWTASTSSA